MTTSRLALLLAILLGGLSSVLLLPKVSREQPLGVDPQLPEIVGGWFGKDVPVSEGEHGVLGWETEFSRKLYDDGRGDELFVSVVLAGHDMNTSIHRPERCMPAQGWTIADTRQEQIPLKKPEHAVLKATRLHAMRTVRASNGQSVAVYNLNYYWFVGYTDLTASHFNRNIIDIKDRLLKGYNQRWAYVTVSGTVTEGLKQFGRSEKELDQLIQSFVQELAPKILKPSLKYD